MFEALIGLGLFIFGGSTAYAVRIEHRLTRIETKICILIRGVKNEKDKKKWGKIGSPKSAKRKAFLKKVRRKR